MNFFIFSIRSFVALALLALVLWSWWFTVAFLSREIGRYKNTAKNEQNSIVQEATEARNAEIVRTTADARARLNAFSGTDVLAAAKTIESIGDSAHVDIRITSAASDSKTPASALRAVTYSFEAEGTFARVMRAAELLATLPIPSMIDQLDFTKIEKDSGKNPSAMWRMNGRIRLFTNATTTP